MQDTKYEILVWLPSPIGDAVLCTPALRAIRRRFESCKISFFANDVVRQVLSPGGFNDRWITQQDTNPFAIAKTLGRYNFTQAILFKNSFGSALACFLAKIPSRIGYARDGRAFLLTDRLYPPKNPDRTFKPVSMIDYYHAIASSLGCDTTNRKPELTVDTQAYEKLKKKVPEVVDSQKPIVVLVPGGAFGPSKCWPPDRFAQIADWLIVNYNTVVVISVADNLTEKQTARQICDLSKHNLINLAQTPLGLDQLKSLISTAELIVSNDTGPRHIAIALRRKVVTMFGPNDPVWTDTGYENETQIVSQAHCAPCNKPKCKQTDHLCMQAITVDMVCDAAKKLLENNHKQSAEAPKQKFTEISKSFFVDTDYTTALSELGLTSIDAVFSFKAGKNLAKPNLAAYRSRLQFEINSPPVTVFLKRYDRPPILVQLRNWLASRGRKNCAALDFESANKLNGIGVSTPKTICYGQQWNMLFEKRSFIITEKILKAQSLEQKLPDFFDAPVTVENTKLRKDFICQLAAFVKKIHESGFRHRDLYLCHIFYSDTRQFYLIDLARVFKPNFFARRFRVKDIAQLHYSAPGRYFSKTDRLRFYYSYTVRNKLSKKDKVFISKVKNKAKRMADHDIKHGKCVPFIS